MKRSLIIITFRIIMRTTSVIVIVVLGINTDRAILITGMSIIITMLIIFSSRR